MIESFKGFLQVYEDTTSKVAFVKSVSYISVRLIKAGLVENWLIGQICIAILYHLLILDNRDMGLLLLGSSFSPFLCMGITFETFRKSGNIPLLEDTLIISLNGSERSVLNSFDIFDGTLLGPVALLGLM